MSDKLPEKPDIYWDSQEALVLDSQDPDNTVRAFLPYSRQQLKEARERRDPEKQQHLPLYGFSSAVRLDQDEHVSRKRRVETSEELTAFIRELVEDLIDLINDPQAGDFIKKGRFVQMNSDIKEISEFFSLLITKLKEEELTDKEIMALCEKIIQPLNIDGNLTSQSAYTILSNFLEAELNSEEAKAGTEEAKAGTKEAKAGTTAAVPIPGGGSKFVKKRFKTQKKGKGKGKSKSKSKSVRRRRGKGTKKPKSNKKRATKRLKK